MRTLDRPGSLNLAHLARVAYHDDVARSRASLAAERKRRAGRVDALRVERTRRCLETVFHRQITLCGIDGTLVWLDSLWFTCEPDEWGRWRLVLVTRCQTCSRTLYRDGFGSLRNLGAILAGLGGRDLVCTVCNPSSLPYLRSFDLDAEPRQEMGG